MTIRSIAEIVSRRPFVTVAPDDTLRSACLRLSDGGVGALAVLAGTEIVGILSDRDIVTRGVCAGLDLDRAQVSEVMTPDPKTVDTGFGLAWAVEIMIEGRFRHLPVVEAGRAIGMLSMRDIPVDYRAMVARFSETRSGATAREPRTIRLH